MQFIIIWPVKNHSYVTKVLQDYANDRNLALAQRNALSGQVTMHAGSLRELSNVAAKAHSFKQVDRGPDTCICSVPSPFDPDDTLTPNGREFGPHREKPMTEHPTYNYKVVHQFAIMTVVWGIVGMLVGVLIAAQLAWPALNFDTAWLSFGRLRPLHTNAVIFAFGGCALMSTSLFIVQRTCHARLVSDKLAAFVFWGWQLVIVLAAITLPMGLTTSKEYAELEWPIDILIAVVWVCYAILFFGTVSRRKDKHIYVANWFFGAFINCRGHPAHHQQPRDAGHADQILLGVFGDGGCDGAVVVRAQCRGLLPDRRLPRHHVLLRAQAGGAAGVLLPPVRGAFLGVDRHLCVGRPPPPALHLIAGLDPESGHGHVPGPAGAFMGRHDQRHHDPLWRLGQTAHRPDPEVPGGVAVVLRYVHV